MITGCRNELDSRGPACYASVKSRRKGMSIILNMDSVGDYNSFLGQETLHPLVSVVDFPGSRRCGMSARLTGFMPFSEGPEMRRPAVRKALL